MRSPPKKRGVPSRLHLFLSLLTIFSLSTPTPIERSPSILIPPLVLPSLAADRFLGSCLLPFPSLAIHPHLSPLSPTSAFLFRSTLCPPPPLRSVPMPTPPLSSVQRRAHVLLLVFFRVRMCACGWESERAQPPTRRGRGELLRTMRYVHARARFFPHSSPGKRCTVPVRCNGNYVKGVACCELTRFHASLSKYLSIVGRD